MGWVGRILVRTFAKLDLNAPADTGQLSLLFLDDKVEMFLRILVVFEMAAYAGFFGKDGEILLNAQNAVVHLGTHGIVVFFFRLVETSCGIDEDSSR